MIVSVRFMANFHNFKLLVEPIIKGLLEGKVASPHLLSDQNFSSDILYYQEFSSSLCHMCQLPVLGQNLHQAANHVVHNQKPLPHLEVPASSTDF